MHNNATVYEDHEREEEMNEAMIILAVLIFFFVILCRRRKESTGEWVRRATLDEENANGNNIEGLEMYMDSDEDDGDSIVEVVINAE